MSQWKRQKDTQRLKTANMLMKKIKEKIIIIMLSKKGMLVIVTGEASKVYRKNKSEIKL